MGTDIHCHAEIRVNGVWKKVALEYDLNARNYALFQTDLMSMGYGIPDDCDNTILEDYMDWEDDAHSASYATLHNILEYKKSAPSQELQELYEFFEDLVVEMHKVNKNGNPNDIRLVFWFDN